MEAVLNPILKKVEVSGYVIERLGEELTLDRALCCELQDVFFESVHSISDRDYSPEQKSAWAPAHLSVSDWMKRLETSTCWIALDKSTREVKGFIELDGEANIDLIYVRSEAQKTGLAGQLFEVAERWVRAETVSKRTWITHVSDAAHDFFIRRGFVPVRRNQIQRGKVLLENTTMQKKL